MVKGLDKVIVIGLDGLEPDIVEAMQHNGELPHMARLQNRGGYSRIKTTYPAQTPVAWSTFSTGTNPGGHGIFDFLSRDPNTYLPVLSLTRYEQKNIFTLPKVVNQRRGVPFWSLLSQAGIPSVVLRCPCTYPPDSIRGRMLAGVGIPDLRGGLGTSTFYTTANDVKEAQGEKLVHIEASRDGSITTQLIGPRDPKSRGDLTLEVTLQVHPSLGKILLRSEGTPKELEIKEGQWSDWLKIKFKAGILQSVHGMVQFFLCGFDPHIELYASPINFDPANPLFPISVPAEYAGELETQLGTYHTLGMAEAHEGLNNERFDETAYLDQCNIVLRDREKMMLYELDRFDRGLFFTVFDTPDRIQHMFWRFLDPQHPSNIDSLSLEMERVISDHYRRCDEIVGKAMEYMEEDTLFIVLSDHGMKSFTRGLNLNTWLWENDYLFLKPGVSPGAGNEEFLQNVDWDRTQAYALGLNGIYLNLKGREANGILDHESVAEINKSIISNLNGLMDSERGNVVVHSVLSRDELYSGPYVEGAPDLIVNFSEGYRVSWDTPLGGIPRELFADNTRRWSGDHVINPTLVPGVLFMNRPFRESNPHLQDMAPTILQAFGVPKGSEMTGKSLLS